MNKSKLSDEMQGLFEVITALTDRVCDLSLNDEYAELSRELTSVLASSPDPLLRRGKSALWACGIVYALGQINFLFDSDSSPCLSAQDLCDAFGVKQSSAYQKALRIRKELDMFPLEPRWCLPSMLYQNPHAWMIEIDGLIFDARHLPRDVQELAYQNGLIPYIPEDPEENPHKIDAIEVTDDKKLRESLRRIELESSREKKRKKQRSTVTDPSQLSLDMDP